MCINKLHLFLDNRTIFEYNRDRQYKKKGYILNDNVTSVLQKFPFLVIRIKKTQVITKWYVKEFLGVSVTPHPPQNKKKLWNVINRNTFWSIVALCNGFE